MFPALPFALLLLTTLSGGSALPNAVGSPEEKATSGLVSAANDEEEPIALKGELRNNFVLSINTLRR